MHIPAEVMRSWPEWLFLVGILLRVACCQPPDENVSHTSSGIASLHNGKCFLVQMTVILFSWLQCSGQEYDMSFCLIWHNV